MAEDKYRPVPARATTETPPWRLVAALCVFGALLALWRAEDLRSLAAYGDAHPAVRRGAEGLADLARQLGVSDLSLAVDARMDAVEHSPVALRRPAPPPPPPPPPEPPKPGFRAPLPDQPAARRVLLVGASSINHHLGVELERCLEDFEGVEVERVGKIGTGLTRPDVFDWRAEVARQLGAFHPDLVLAQLGGNDCQKMYGDGGAEIPFATGRWNTEYGRRLGTIAGEVDRGGADFAVITMPTPKDGAAKRCYELINDATRAGAAAAGAETIEAWSLTAGPDGAAIETAHGALAWMTDGVHLQRPAAEEVAARLCDRLQRSWTLLPRDASLAPFHAFTLRSAARGKETTWFAAVPRTIPAEGLPTLYLLHGAWGAGTDWPDHAQRELQRLAEETGLIVVIPDGDPHGWWLDSALVAGSRLETYVVDELIPEVERRLPANGARGIAGLSMGGHGAASLAMRHPGLFRSVSAMSGALDLEAFQDREELVARLGPLNEAPARWREHSALHLVADRPEAARALAWRLSCGAQDRRLPASVAFHEELVRLGVPHVWETSPGAHEWSWWVGELPAHVRWHAAELSR